MESYITQLLENKKLCGEQLTKEEQEFFSLVQSSERRTVRRMVRGSLLNLNILALVSQAVFKILSKGGVLSHFSFSIPIHILLTAKLIF